MIISEDELAEEIGDFTWNFGEEFLIETKFGNFIWSDPDYQGTGEIHSFKGDVKAWNKKNNIPYGRSKGKHQIGRYCGDFKLVEDYFETTKEK